MTDIVTKVSIWGQVVPIGWGSEWQEVVYLTQAEYDALPASKLTDGKIYKVKTSGVVPGGSTNASDVEYDNTTSWLTADNVQEAIDEVVQEIPTIQSIEDTIFAPFTTATTNPRPTQISWDRSSEYTPSKDVQCFLTWHGAAGSWTTQWVWIQEKIWTTWKDYYVLWTTDFSISVVLYKWHTYRLTAWTVSSSKITCSGMYERS